MPAPEISSDEHEKLEFERIEDLRRTARALLDRAVERLSIETANFRRARIHGGHAAIICRAALAVLEQI